MLHAVGRGQRPSILTPPAFPHVFGTGRRGIVAAGPRESQCPHAPPDNPHSLQAEDGVRHCIIQHMEAVVELHDSFFLSRLLCRRSSAVHRVPPPLPVEELNFLV